MKAKTISVHGCSGYFTKKISAQGFTATKGKADISVLGENWDTDDKIDAKIVFVPENIGQINIVNCVSLVSAGMGGKATLSFSSINDDTAVLSVSRQVDLGGKTASIGEVKTPFDLKLSIYENLILGFLTHFM